MAGFDCPFRAQREHWPGPSSVVRECRLSPRSNPRYQPELNGTLEALLGFKPESPISSCLDPSNAPSSTRAIVVSLTDAVNHPIKLTKPSLGVVSSGPRQRRWLSPRLHSLQTPPGTHLALGCLSSPLMTSRIIATLVLDGARRYAPTLAGIPPGTLPPQQAETPTSWQAAPDVHPS